MIKTSRYVLEALVMSGMAILGSPNAQAAPRLDLLVSGLWIESLGYSVIPLSGTVAGGVALDLHFSPGWSVAAGAALPSDVGVSLPEVGSIRLTVYTVTADYHFFANSRFSPYLGAGAYHSLQSRSRDNGVISIDASGTGWVAQAGIDWRIGSRWFANLDFRYLGGLETTALIANTVRLPIPINPLIVGLGIGYSIH